MSEKIEIGLHAAEPEGGAKKRAARQKRGQARGEKAMGESSHILPVTS